MTATTILIGNILSLCAMISDSVSGTRKKRNEILGVQIISQVFYGASSTVLKGYSATVQNAVAVGRNFVATKEPKNQTVKKAIAVLLVVAGVVLGIVLNNRGALGLLPVLANLEYSAAVFKLADNERALKIAFIINSAMFAVFNAVIWNYVGVFSCAAIIVTTAIALAKGRKTDD